VSHAKNTLGLVGPFARLFFSALWLCGGDNKVKVMLRRMSAVLNSESLSEMISLVPSQDERYTFVDGYVGSPAVEWHTRVYS